VIPEGIVTTGWPAVEAKCREFGDEFDEWQRGAGRVILGKRADGLYAATVGGITLSIPRQVAKTFLVGRIIFALCVLFPGLRVLWTAHHTATLSNTFRSLSGFARRKKVAPHVANVRRGSGKEAIEFTNGSVIYFGARSQGFGRGFDEVDVEVFDEAQILDEKALEDMVAATNQTRHPHGALLFFMGTPPRPIDPGEAFKSRRKKALAVKKGLGDFMEPVALGDAVYIECSADPDVGKPGGPSLDSEAQLKKANPSYPHRTPPTSIARLRENLNSDESWRREGLGVHDDGLDTTQPVISRAQWEACGIPAAPTEGIPSYGIKFSPDGSTVALAAAKKTPRGGPIHVELIDRRSISGGTGWLIAWLAGGEDPRWKRAAAIVIDGKAHAGNLINALREAGVPARVIVAPTTDQVTTAHSMLLEAVQAKAKRVTNLKHSGQSTLVDSVESSGRRPIGTAGGWGFLPINNGECTSAESAVMAHWGAKTSKRVPGRKQRVVVG
jgi:hypothetical protein